MTAQLMLVGSACPSDLPRLTIPLFLEGVSAGFPSPAQDFVERALDLNELLIAHPAATYFVRVDGDSMTGAGIYSEDILVVDRSLRAEHGDIVIAGLNGELTVKRLELRPVVRLVACNPAYAPIRLADGIELDVFGVVTGVVRTVSRRRSGSP